MKTNDIPMILSFKLPLSAPFWVHKQKLHEATSARNRPDDGSAVLVTDVRDNIEIRSPELKLSLPVDDCWQRSTHQERTLTMTLSKWHSQHLYCHNPLPEYCKFHAWLKKTYASSSGSLIFQPVQQRITTYRSLPIIKPSFTPKLIRELVLNWINELKLSYGANLNF